jgi:hypothetical protein
VTPGDRNYLLRVARGKCEYCGDEIIGRGLQAEIHHIVPFSSRGSDNYHNLIVLCPNCHSKANHISKESFRLKIAYRLPKKTLVKNNAVKGLKSRKTSVKNTTNKENPPPKTTTKKKSPKTKKTTRVKPTLKNRKISTKKLSVKKTSPKKKSIKKISSKSKPARKK